VSGFGPDVQLGVAHALERFECPPGIAFDLQELEGVAEHG
jgi:hypothetical protein